MPYKVLEHKADLAIHVIGHSLTDLFSEEMRAMIVELKPQGLGKDEILREISISAADKTALLIDFLNEILALTQVNQEIYKSVFFKNLSENHCSARLSGVAVSGFGEDIKAATYHSANIQKNALGDWQTSLLFDI